MFQKSKLMVFLSLIISVGLFAASCKKKNKTAKKGEKCNSSVKCEKGTKCHFGLCEDLTMQSKECKYLKSASRGIMDASPKSLIKGVNHDSDMGYVSDISSQAANLYKAFARGLSQKQCANMIKCQLPKLGIGTAWFWTRSAFEANKQLPPGAIKIPKNPISIVSVIMKQGSMGEDESLFPKEKIKMMQDHRIGCESKVKFRVSEKFAGFVTFHYWRDKCKLKPADKNKADSEPPWECKGEEILNQPFYTQTIYLYPYTDAQLREMRKKVKGKDKKGFITGNPGTYTLSVWAYNPINEKLFAQHKQFEGKELEKMKTYQNFKFCPKYTDNAFNNGCACLGFKPSKITVTTSPDPFHLPYDQESCEKADKAKSKK